MAVVRDPSLVSWLVMSFEQLWADSMPLEAPASATRQDVQLAHTQAAILRMLAEGEKDEAISRRLSILFAPAVATSPTTWLRWGPPAGSRPASSQRLPATSRHPSRAVRSRS